jgi:hypothetical protein
MYTVMNAIMKTVMNAIMNTVMNAIMNTVMNANKARAAWTNCVTGFVLA